MPLDFAWCSSVVLHLPTPWNIYLCMTFTCGATPTDPLTYLCMTFIYATTPTYLLTHHIPVHHGPLVLVEQLDGFVEQHVLYGVGQSRVGCSLGVHYLNRATARHCYVIQASHQYSKASSISISHWLLLVTSRMRISHVASVMFLPGLSFLLFKVRKCVCARGMLSLFEFPSC